MRPGPALVPVVLLVLAGCASGPTTSGPIGSISTAGTSGTAAPSTGTSSSSTTSKPSTAATAVPTTSGQSGTPVATALPTALTDVNQSINDPDLSQSVAVSRIARQLPWPAGYSASAQAYELVAVEMTWTPSKTYTIPISQQDFTINTGGALPNTPDNLVDGVLKAGGWALLPGSVSTGDAVSGWMVFKVDPKAAPKLVLDYTRPASMVSESSQTFSGRTFSITLVG